MVFGYNRLVIHQILGTETGHPEDNAMNWQNEHNITKLHVRYALMKADRLSKQGSYYLSCRG